jgi:hypothetical protein
MARTFDLADLLIGRSTQVFQQLAQHMGRIGFSTTAQRGFEALRQRADGVGTCFGSRGDLRSKDMLRENHSEATFMEAILRGIGCSAPPPLLHAGQCTYPLWVADRQRSGHFGGKSATLPTPPSLPQP